jgi:hypothetical protein
MSAKLLPGQRPPLAVISPDDQGGAIFVTGALALAICAICLVVRAYVRAGYMNNTFGPDDIVIAVAFVCPTTAIQNRKFGSLLTP